MAKSKIRQEARELRKKGLGVKTIAYKLGVSSSTVSLWCRDILLTQEQLRELERRSRDPRYGRRLAYTEKQKRTRLKKVRDLFRQGSREIGQLTDREVFLAGVALYWAEGFKKDNLVGFSNSDPSMILFFIRWLQLISIDKSRLKFRVGINEAYRKDAEEIVLYWQTTLHVTKDQFQKPFFQKVKWQKVYDHPENYHGVLRVRVSKSIDLLRKIHGWIAGLG